MNRKVLGLIAVVAVILIVSFSVKGLNDEDKEKKIVANIPVATQQREAVVSLEVKKEEIVASDSAKEEEAFVSKGVKEIQQLQEEAGKENPLTEKQMIDIAQDQVKTYYSFLIVDTERELEDLAKKFYFYYDSGLENAKKIYTPGLNSNMKVAFVNEKVTKNGKDAFTYVAKTSLSVDDDKTKTVDSIKQNVNIEFLKAQDGTYKVVYIDSATIAAE